MNQYLKSLIAIVFLIMFSSTDTLANLYFTQSEVSINIYSQIDEKALIVIPLKDYDFISLSQKKFNIKEKLGSYKAHCKSIEESKNLQLVSIKNLSSNEIELKYEYTFGHNKENITLYFKEQNEEIILETDLINNQNINHLSFNFVEETKAIFGGGIQFSFNNLKGKSFPLIVEENGVGRGDEKVTFWANLLGAAGNEFTTYAPMPIFLTNNQTKYKLGSPENHFWEVNFEQENILQYDFNLIGRSVINLQIKVSRDHITKSISNENTAQRFPLKDWMYGYTLGVQGGKNRVDSLINVFKTNGIDVSAIWIQDWVGKQKTPIGSRLQWNWMANENYYPNIKQWIDSLHQQNIKVLAYINPYFVEGKTQANEGIEKEFFVKDDLGESYKFKAGGFEAYMLDLSNNEARTWAKNIIKTEMIETGFDGWMCDFGEWLPFSPNLKNDIRLTHNNFPVEWAKLNWEAIKEANKQEDLFVFNRSAYSGTLDLPVIMWLGDQMSNFGVNDGLASAINAYNSASFSGFPITHSDIGGYTAIKMGPLKFLRSEELLKRWIEMETFTPLFRSHEGLKPVEMTQIYSNKNMLKFFKKFNDIHNDLIPYFKEVNDELVENGTPMIRHPFLLYPEDENTLAIQYQFFVGDSLLVCPVYKENSTSVDIYLPEGKWSHFFTKEIYEGKKYYTVSAPIGKPCVFWRLKE